MFIGSDSVKYRGEIPVAGMVLRLANDPSIHKDGGTLTATFTAYASQEAYEEKRPLQKRYLTVTLCENQERASQLQGPVNSMDGEIRVAYYCPDVVRAWGKKPTSSRGILQDADWPDNLWAQAQLLAGMIPEMEGFSSDEASIQAAISAGVAETNARKPKPAP